MLRNLGQTDVLKTVLKRAVQKITEEIAGLIGQKVTDKITKVSKTSNIRTEEQFEMKDLTRM